MSDSSRDHIDTSNVWGFVGPEQFARSSTVNSAFFSPSIYDNFASSDKSEVHSWTYAALRARANGVSSIPVRVYTGTKEKRKPVADEHPLQSLFGKPNESYSEAFFWRMITRMLDVKGYVAIVIDAYGDETGTPLPYSGGIPKMMDVIDADNFRVEMKEGRGRGEPGKQLYKKLADVDYWQHIAKPALRFQANQVIYIENVDGAPLRAARLAVEGDYGAAVYSKKFVDNDCNPSGWFKHPKFMLDPEYKQFLERRKQENAGVNNAGGIMLLDNGVEWVPNPQTNRDMQWLEGRRFWQEEIEAVFGTPKAMLNVGGDAKYSNHVSQQRVFLENTIFPIHAELVDAFWSQLLSNIEGGKYGIYFDKSNHPALESDLDDRASVGEKFVRMGFPLNAVNERLNLGFEAVDGGDQGLIAAGLIPISDVGFSDVADDEDADTKNSPEALTPEQVTAILAIVSQVTANTLPPESAKQALALGYDLTTEQINKLIDPAESVEQQEPETESSDDDDQDQPDNSGRCAASPTSGPRSETVGGRGFLLSGINQRAEIRERGINNAKKYIDKFRRKEVRKRKKSFKSKMTKMLMDQRRELLASFDKMINAGRSRGIVWNEPWGNVDRETGKRAPTALTADDINEITFDKQRWDAQLAKLFDPIYTDMIETTGRNTLTLLGKESLVFDVTNPRWTEVINKRVGEYLVDVNQETIDQVRKALRKSLSLGETPTEMKARLRQMSGFSRARATTVAVTEMGSVINETRRGQFDQFEIDDVVWVTTGTNSRDTHKANEAHGKVRRGEPFPNGLRWPHDDGPPEEVINCSCDIMVPLSDEALSDVAAFAAEE